MSKSKIAVISIRSPLTIGRYGCRCRHKRTDAFVSSANKRLHMPSSSKRIRKIVRFTRPYMEARGDLCACWMRYDVTEMKEEMGGSAGIC